MEMHVNYIISNFLRDIHLEKMREWMKNEHLKISSIVKSQLPTSTADKV